jgi:DNA polymerase-3 subunit alpha
VKLTPHGHDQGRGQTMNGNGQHHDTATRPPVAGRILRLYLPRTGDHDGDVRRMQDVYSVLRESAGPDQVTLYLPNGVGRVVLESQHRVAVSPGLLEALRRVLGPERVVVE